MRDVTAILMGDPSARFVRQATAKEAEGRIVRPNERPNRSCGHRLGQGRHAARCITMKVGDVILVETSNERTVILSWFSRNGGLAKSRRTLDGTYAIERVG